MIMLAVMASASAIELKRDDAIGQQFGMPGPRTCSGTDQPADGPPSAEDARALVICAEEGVFGSGSLALVTDVNIQVAPNGRPYTYEDAFDGIDPSRPVYDIRGTLAHYACNQVGYGDSPLDQTCRYGVQDKGQGICFQTTFGEWQCTFYDSTHDVVGEVYSAPPTADQQ
jgi:hypothetical protein